MKLGVQIFGCLRNCRRDPDVFFKRLADCGYSVIEYCVLFDEPEPMKQAASAKGDDFTAELAGLLFKPDELPFFFDRMAAYGLQPGFCHVFSGDLLSALPLMLETAQNNGITAYVVNCPQDTIARRYEDFAAACRKAAEILLPSDIRLLFHNNAAEIAAKLSDGRTTVLEQLLKLTEEGHTGVQVDVGWAWYGGEEPLSYLQRVKPYLASIHLKDPQKGSAVFPGNAAFACLGDGCLNTPGILAFALENGIDPILIDQDSSEGDIMEDLERSAVLLQRLLKP